MFKRLLKNERGANTTELMLIIGTLSLLSLGVVDVGRLMTEYNAIQKAVESGAREAVTRDPIVLPIKWHFYCNVPSDTAFIGQLCIDEFGVQRPECDFGTYTCTDTGCTGPKNVTYASGDCNGPDPGQVNMSCLSRENFDGIFDHMEAALPGLTPDLVTITYKPNGLGFIGMAGSPPADVTVAIAGVPFGFVASLPFGRIAWEIPRMHHTFTGEDMSNNSCADQGLTSTNPDANGVYECKKTGSPDELIPLCYTDPP
jgi:Flp pilus assembly pilin Flp